MYAGTACAKPIVTTDVTNATRGDSDEQSMIYCPMPFQPDSYSVCCLNAAEQTRCCQTTDAPVERYITYVHRRLREVTINQSKFISQVMTEKLQCNKCCRALERLPEKQIRSLKLVA